jgi:hypothetical protein
MAISEQPVTTEAARAERRPPRITTPNAMAATARVVARLGQLEFVERASESAWRFIHPLGIHRWRDGYVTDAERGWTQYRGSRCTVCDEPWEGW